MSEIRVTDIKGENGLDAVNFTKGINVSSGVCTATTFSGSGASLTSLPAGNLTGTLPAISGANLTNVGKVLQVVQQHDTSFTRAAVSSTTMTATTHQVSITPTRASSKILVNFSGCSNNNGANNIAYFTIFRSINGGTFADIAPSGSGNYNRGFTLNKSEVRSEQDFNIMYLDSPSYSVGNAIVYKIYLRNNGAGSVEIPHSPNGEPVMCFAQEIAA